MNGWKNIKNDSKDFLRRLKKSRIKSWQIAMVMILAIIGSVWGLRSNNLTMIHLRNQVLAADASGKNIQKPLSNLSTFVFHHMNSSVNDLELVNSYNRDVADLAAKAKTAKGQPNIYQQAQNVCEQAGEMITTIAQCAQNYVLTHLPKSKTATVKFPDKTLYSYSFASPKWSPDLAGFSLVIAMLSAAWLSERGITWLIASLIVRRRYHS
jgi:hypothetical protein